MKSFKILAIFIIILVNIITKISSQEREACFNPRPVNCNDLGPSVCAYRYSHKIRQYIKSFSARSPCHACRDQKVDFYIIGKC